VIDTGSDTVVATITGLPGPPSGLAVTPNGARAYVAVPSAGRVLTVMVGSRKIAAQVAVPGDPSTVAVTSDGAQVWVACESAGQVRMIRPATPPASDALDPTIVPLARRPVAVAASPAGAVDADGVAYRATVLVPAQSGSDLTLVNPSLLDQPPQQRIGSPISSTILLGSGLGERLSWATIPFTRGDAALSSAVAQSVRATGKVPGELLLRALYSRPGRTNPYEFEVRLAPNLDTPSTVIRKDQYDIVMNVLNTFHPIGVEVRTHNVREHVVEVATGAAEALPGYTFPPFRTGGLPPAEAPREGGRG
jgi:hypothetical protein